MTRWHLCTNGVGIVLRTEYAPDITTARNLLHPRGDQYVISAASYAVGFSKPLHPDRCKSCGLRNRIPNYEVCLLCRNAHRRATAAETDYACGERRQSNGQTRAEKRASHLRWQAKRKAKLQLSEV